MRDRSLDGLADRASAIRDSGYEAVWRLTGDGVDPGRTVALACDLSDPEARRIAGVLVGKRSARSERSENIFVVVLSVFDALAVLCGDDVDFAFEVVTLLDRQYRMLPYAGYSGTWVLGGAPVASVGFRVAPVIERREQELEAALELVFRRIEDTSEAMKRAPDEWDDECQAKSDDANAALAHLLERCAADD